ncbi:hypothetical protein COCC4DRAFT_122548 [Bipolaris maydis ATCC 48331]|uniref:Nicotianamine synthase n=2 Tax=Cochliobolus heterostrophus TaxID=5016 RepID=M2UPK1_COCH5|nr:uncharacterized protein COCC4DRAFT_122548 [Bipolaris maydis ATCC 48331]EMD95516.1 hypothetical protein COCHEDRAFT_99611 [Bipolaris maydis C5]KAH7561476.1 hypothetical protein BM1_02580 [Bipolaris maydis]ENI10380.1 hypothetical protein COCC4DRAFT_122548 [Bipolaris maydis ATCC 48331]KAJ5030278.1 Nicotianamine synthase [Bipolaris maydis]KAJ5041372.1 Nicotianamine synthase [Bipolaris maydis]
MATTQLPSTTSISKPTPLAKTLTVTPPVTPNGISAAVHQLVAEIRDIHSRLSELSSLAPSYQVNTLLTRLVNLCVVPYSAEFTAYFFNISGVEQLCDKLRPICSEAEGELEKFHTERMLKELDTIQEAASITTILQSFPYYDNYVDLSRLEASLINAFASSPPTSIAFIGSGPLPLTSLCFLSQYPNAHIHNVDRDATALRLSAALCTKLGFSQRMSFTNEDITQEGPETQVSWTESQVVFLAALVGTDTRSKLEILRDLAARLQPGCLVVARSARGMRSVLYPILQLSEDLQAIGLEMLAELHPWTNVVNSAIVLRVKER